MYHAVALISHGFFLASTFGSLGFSDCVRVKGETRPKQGVTYAENVWDDLVVRDLVRFPLLDQSL